MARENDVELTATCPELHIDADPVRLGQILHNLISNAVRCAPGGRVQVTAAGQDGQAVLCVRDDGVGMTSEQIENLFQPFAQIEDGSLQQRQGTGLGLYVTRQLARLHGGDVTAASRGRRHGAVFTVTLPLAVPETPLLAA